MFDNPKLLFERNTDKIVELMNSTDADNVDIIVFPESSFNTLQTSIIVPPVNDKRVDLCASTNKTQFSRNLKKIACAAKRLQMYVVLNLYMREHKQQGSPVYNANVVFDRHGTVISM